jgi:putative DNA helicase
VKSAPEVSGRSLLDFDVPLVWIDAAAEQAAETTDDLPAAPVGEELVGGSYGRINRAEARLTIDTLKRYIERIGRQRFLDERLDVGIISPYRVQVQELRRLVRADAALKPFRSLITVNTVDGFQGQERDIIMVSLVRANSQGQIGFLRDLRRMNVAMTRARHKLFVLGDVATLTRHRFYRALHEYSEQLKEGSFPDY